MMTENVWESRYFDAYDKVLLNSEIYLVARDFHINAMKRSRIVLDSGCSTGNVTLELLRRGHTVYAVDSSKKALDILRKKCAQYTERLHINNVDAKNLPFRDEMFDGITSMFVVYYVDDVERYLRENYRVLKKNGAFALSGRISAENMELVLKSYEESLRKKGLLPKLEPEFSVFREKFLDNVTKAVINAHTFEQMKGILENTGFIDTEEFPNPYFGQCYSLITHK